MALRGKTDRRKIWNYFHDKGLSDYAAAGLMGNLYAESGLKSTNLQNSCEKRLGMSDDKYTTAVDNGEYTNFVKDSAGYGLAQWTYWSRKEKLLNFARGRGGSIGDLEMQLDFLWKELSENYRLVMEQLRTTKSIREASDAVLLGYEKPANQSDSVKKLRASYGQSYYDLFLGKTSETKKVTVSQEISISPQAVIDVALGEVGYLEKSKAAYQKNPAVLDDKTAGAGSDNYTKYGRDMHALYPAVMDFPAYWCDCFVDWCFYKAYGAATAKSLLGGNFDDYTVASCNMYSKMGALHRDPTPGDQVFFTRNGQVSGCHHTGIVYAVEGNYFMTVEGNTSGANGVVSNGGGVAKKKYRIADYKGKTLFGRHPYGKKLTVAKETVSGASSILSKEEAWRGKVTASTLNVRRWAGAENEKLRSLPIGTPVSVCDTVQAKDGSDWYYIKEGGKYGFVSSNFIAKV